ncbi:hypothetical protein CROQUDRAFT_98274 [Cronartium quercuum f. sp. fusiforme G11]|uniref:Uncharacterized protein n=1 Tax=Cronartium quercuum f. sp. fusiforme G11 TaxID=708437 RepID=A0A9P6T7R7_9BASI|nr:hypothetical protein CROQUDRAFT_98274 [Cronartium quercuum f. sp. fusiforme G11]
MLAQANNLHPLLAHLVISSPNPEQQCIAAMNIIHTCLVWLMRHQASSNDQIKLVFRATPAQTGDEALLDEWRTQIHCIEKLGEGGISMTPGCFSLLREVWPWPGVGYLDFDREFEVIAEEADDEGDEEDIFIQGLDDNILSLALEELGLDEETE